MGALHSACMFLGVSNASSVQPVVSIERTVFYREKAAGMYSPLAYAAAQAVVEVPYIAVQTLTYGIITYFMIGFERTLSMFTVIHPKLNSYERLSATIYLRKLFYYSLEPLLTSSNLTENTFGDCNSRIII